MDSQANAVHAIGYAPSPVPDQRAPVPLWEVLGGSRRVFLRRNDTCEAWTLIPSGRLAAYEGELRLESATPDGSLVLTAAYSSDDGYAVHVGGARARFTRQANGRVVEHAVPCGRPEAVRLYLSEEACAAKTGDASFLATECLAALLDPAMRIRASVVMQLASDAPDVMLSRLLSTSKGIWTLHAREGSAACVHYRIAREGRNKGTILTPCRGGACGVRFELGRTLVTLPVAPNTPDAIALLTMGSMVPVEATIDYLDFVASRNGEVDLKAPTHDRWYFTARSCEEGLARGDRAWNGPRDD